VLIAVVANRLFRALADHIEFALEGQRVAAIQGVGVAANEDLAHERLAGNGGGAQRAVVGGHVAPAQHRLPFLGHNLLELRLEGAARIGVFGQKDHAHAILAQGRQRTAAFSGDAAEKLVGHLHVDAGAVAGVGFAAARAAVIQVHQHGHGLAHDGVRAHALDVDDKADAAGVFFKGRVVQALLGRRTGRLWRRWAGRLAGIRGHGHLLLTVYASGDTPRRWGDDRQSIGWFTRRGGKQAGGRSEKKRAAVRIAILEAARRWTCVDQACEIVHEVDKNHQTTKK
jgi:hypothetical protein